jgi:hypothetical protein
VSPARARSAALAQHLTDSGLAGAVATGPRSTLDNCARLVAGHPEYTFGLSDHRSATVVDAVAAVQRLCGGDPGAADPDGPGWINPQAALQAVEHHRRVLARAAGDGLRVLLGTGHPTGLLAHYGALSRSLQAAGCAILAPLDDTFLAAEDGFDHPVGIRYIDGVACLHDGGRLLHTHRSAPMEAILDELGGAPTRSTSSSPTTAGRARRSNAASPPCPSPTSTTPR